MHHSFFTVALLIFSNALVRAQDPNTLMSTTPNPTTDGNPTPTTPTNPGATTPLNPGPTNPGTGTPPVTPGPTIPGTGTPAPPTTGAPAMPPRINGTVLCESKFFAFSERDLDRMAKEDNPQNTTETDLPDASKLSDVPTVSLCVNSQYTALCELDSCPTTADMIPQCTDCHQFTPGANGQDGTVNPAVIPQATCDGSYSFNATDKYPYTCLVQKTQILSCTSCHQSRACNVCYDAKNLPNKP
ncbi:hypothetical protein PCANC_00965 [Puccinia coronata f. sp. avenae]|uniref:Uncharacterized protein n=1 Tax=Puccinia coronata f. sp. avenae TaxID=200324 RepID=A0A2N5W6K8_9BASI|nr:hypothetical protein PCANC_00965 [Puccinia coronata f. sp. avenae]